jgi:autotransporter-associated beta strand protein
LTATSATVGTATPISWVGADAQTERVFLQGTGSTGPNVIVNGSSTINLDRTGLVTAGSSAAQGSNKQIVLGNLSIGSEILTVSSGNGYGLEFSGTTSLSGNAFFNNSVDLVLNGAVSSGGADVLINKIGNGVLWVNSNNSANLVGPTYINAGMLDWGNRLAQSTTANLGVGDIFVNAGASARIRGVANVNTALGQQMYLTSTPYSSALIRPVGSVTQAQLKAIIGDRTTTSNEVTYLSWEGGTLNNNLDQSQLGDGRIYFGAIGDRTYNGTGTGSIIPGLANHPNAVVGGASSNRVYRFGHNSANTLTIDLAGTGTLNDVGGATDVQIGSLATLGLNNWNTGFVYFQDQNTYTGQTVVSRGLTLRFNKSMSTGDAAGPLGANAGSLIDVYGGLRVEAAGSFRNFAGTGNFYNTINLHPLSTLIFQDTGSTTNFDRWDNATGINLDGSGLQIEAQTNNNDNRETVGAISFDRGSRIILSIEGTGDAFLTAASIDRAAASTGAGSGRGTLVFAPSASAAFGVTPTAGVAQTQAVFTTAPTTSSVSAVASMLPGYYVEGNAHRFVKNGANGVLPVADGDMVSFSAGMTAGSAVVNLTVATNLPDFNPVIFALRGGNFALSSPTGANNDATITFGGSGSDVGGVISTGNTFTINPNLKFGTDGSNEAIFYAGGNIQFNGNLTAGSVTKFGTGTLVIGNDQSDAARGAGNGYSGGWVVNEGGLQLSQFGSAGNADANNTIVLNGSRESSGALFLRAQPGDTLLNYTYTSGKIYAVDNATIDWDPGADDRVHTISDIEIQQSGGLGSAPVNGTVDAQLRIVNNRNRSILSAGQLTITNNAILNVDSTTGSNLYAVGTANGSYLTNGVSSGMSVASVVGSDRLTKWGDGTLYVRGDSSANFSGTMVIDQGAVHVSHNGSLGSGALIINRYGVLEVGVSNFVPANSSVTYNEGSIERWSVNNARSGNVNLGKGTLQVAANQPTTNASITLDGGGIEAFLRNDDINDARNGGGVMRILNPNINITLNSNSFIGTQYYLGANGLDAGKQPMDYISVAEYTASGAILEVQGVISGAGGLTKVGYDAVILSGNNTYAGATAVNGGRVLLGKDDALPATTNLSTTSNGVLDLNGQNQTVAKLQNPVVSTVANVTSGFITNSATTTKTLTVGNGISAGDNFTYSGVIQHNVALTKTGGADLTLNNINTYTGATHINGGAVKLGANAGINDSAWLNIGAGSTFDVSAKTGGYSYDGRISGGGSADAAGTAFASLTSAAKIVGNLVVGDHIGDVSLIGSMSPGGNLIAGDISTAGNQIGHIQTNGNLTLSGQLTGSSPAVPVTRMTLQIGGATSNLTTLGYTTGDFLAFIDTLPTLSALTTDTLNGAAGTMSGHDYVKAGGTFSINANGRIEVSYLTGYIPTPGDIFNLLDWTALTNTGFTAGPRSRLGGETNYDLLLPTLGSGQFWDTSLFLSHGTLVVIPEPGRALLMLLGLMALAFRRRRQD